MLQIGLDGFNGAHFKNIRGIDIHFTLEGEEVVGSENHPALPPLSEELRSLIKYALLDLVVPDLAVDHTVIHSTIYY